MQLCSTTKYLGRHSLVGEYNIRFVYFGLLSLVSRLILSNVLSYRIIMKVQTLNTKSWAAAS